MTDNHDGKITDDEPQSTALSSVIAVNASSAAPSTSHPTSQFPADSAAPSHFEGLVVTAVTNQARKATRGFKPNYHPITVANEPEDSNSVRTKNDTAAAESTYRRVVRHR